MNKRFSYLVTFFIVLTFVFGLIFGRLLWPRIDSRYGSAIYQIREIAIEKLKAQVTKVIARNATLTKEISSLKAQEKFKAIAIEELKAQITEVVARNIELTEEIDSLKTRINERDQEIENLRNKIHDPGGPKGEVVQLGNELVREQQNHVDGQQELGQAPEGSTFLETDLRWYEIIRETPLLRNPSEKAEVLMHLMAGHKVGIMDIVDGKWLNVFFSGLDNPRGYIRVEDAVPTIISGW